MTAKNKPEKIDKSKTLNIPIEAGKSRDTLLAELALNGVANSATVAVAFSKSNYGDLALTECMQVLTEKVVAVRQGNLRDAETLLVGQAMALDAIFASLARRAQMNMGEYMNAADRYMRLALKAQGQCRATLETLATIKNPPLVFAKQANITNGPQQVNNTVNKSDVGFDASTRGHAHAGNSNSVQNELLEDSDE
ncbi:MAG: hypothetical protein FGM23_05070 [Alphaproteobacteria bacterium]|nr:hypothetical protein [Alphaproteobacteria bacterium]